MKDILRRAQGLALVAALAVMPVRAYALPTGETVITPGTTVAVDAAGTTMTVTQGTSKAIIEYNSFSIGSGETVNFVQPSASAVALNRVTGGTSSSIMGSLTANGQIFLVNPNGIVFGTGSQINVGALVASTVAISNVDFLAGNYAFGVPGVAGKSIVNQGTIRATGPGGYVALLGSSVENAGLISTVGKIALAGGDRFTLSLDATGLLNVAVDSAATANPAAAADQIKNSGTLKAGDKVILNAKAAAGLVTNAINNAGVIEGTNVAFDANGNVVITGSITADAGTGYGVVTVKTSGTINAPGTIIARGQGDHVVDMAETVMKDIAGTKTYSAKYTYGSKVEIQTDGDITLGNVSADYVSVLGDASIYSVGQVAGHLVILVAANDIGTSAAPITTNADVLAGYSFDKGSVYINEVDSVELGFYLPVTIVDSLGNILNGGLGMSLAANNGIVHVQAGNDITVNSVVTPHGGVFLQSTAGSIYAGNGWKITSGNPLVNKYLSFPAMSLTGTPWAIYKTMSPVVLTFANPKAGYNIIAGDYSYLSSLYGTIGVGTSSSKDAAMSGGVSGTVLPGETAVTGVANAPGFDPIYGYPEGYVVYNGAQIYPAAAGTGLTAVNPLQVLIKMATGGQPAVRDGFTPTSLLTLQFGAPSETPDFSGDTAAAINQYLRAYYEILNLHRVVGFEPAVPTTFYGYHPLTPTDSSAFDGISLDEGFYQFMDNNIRLNNPLNSYFGEEDSRKKK